MKPLRTLLILATCSTLSITGCGDDGGGGGTPTDVAFGETAIVVVINPTVDDENDVSMPVPGAGRAGIVLTSDDGVSATTSAEGIAVLGPLTAGQRTITIAGADIDGSFDVTLRNGELRELAVAAEATRVEIMVELDYKADQLTEITPDMTNTEVNDALRVSDTVVFLNGGTYVGDLDFSGSRVTLFGEGLLGGAVTIDGNITVSGSDSRVRGAHITGDLTMPASGGGVSFSLVDGNTTAEGSDATILSNTLGGTRTITGSGSIVLGN